MAICGLCCQVISTTTDQCAYCQAPLSACNLRPFVLPAVKQARWTAHRGLVLSASVLVAVLVSFLILLVAGAFVREPLAGDNPITGLAGVAFAGILLALGILVSMWVFSGWDSAQDLRDLYPAGTGGASHPLEDEVTNGRQRTARGQPRR